MAGFLDWFFAFLTTIVDGIWMMISDLLSDLQ